MKSVYVSSSLRTAALVFAASVLMLICEVVRAQTPLLNEVHTVATSARGVPVEHTFTVSLAGTYKVTLTDLGAALTPSAPLVAGSLKLAITSGNTVVGTPLVGAGALQFDATAGSTYTVHITGTPGTVPGSGPISVVITNTADGSQLEGYSDSLGLPPTALPSNQSVLDSSFTVGTAGNYTVTLTDLQLPQSLSTLTLALAAVGGGGTIITTLTVTSTTNPASQTVALQPNTTYRIFAVAEANSNVNAGLYSASVRDATNAVVFSSALPVGQVTQFTPPTTGLALSAGTYSLVFTDLAYPGALPTTPGATGAVAVLADQAVATLTSPGTKTFTVASAGATYQVFAYAAPAGVPGTGSYSLQVLPSSGGTAALSVAQAVNLPNSAYTAFTFTPKIATAGNYTAQLADYTLPAALTSVSLAAVQGGVSLGQPLTSPGNLAITAAVGPLYLLVFAQGTSSGGMFGADVIPGTAGTPVFQTTQGVGAGTLFTARQVSVTTPGSYDINVSDVGFPEKLANLWVLVTSGPTSSGSILGSGVFSFPATPGQYIVNFFAQPSTSTPTQGSYADQAGTYSINVVPSPPAPSVSLTSDQQTVNSGATVNLKWSSTNATSCEASGGWSGALATSGNQPSAALTATTTFTLICTEADGQKGQAAVTVTVNATSPGGHGGGSVEWTLLAALATTLLLRRRLLSGRA